MKIFIGADHRGFKLKEMVKAWLIEEGFDVTDCGNVKHDPDDDFPDYTFAVCDEVVKDEKSRGIVICGSAGGVTIAANKVHGIRCVWGVTEKDMVHNRKHDNVNVLALSSDYIDVTVAQGLVRIFLDTPFAKEEERFVRRLKKIEDREMENCGPRNTCCSVKKEEL